jgi:hypothetical protein
MKYAGRKTTSSFASLSVVSPVASLPDRFCETCRLTTARKANRGHSPLEVMEELVPGSFVMVDILANPTTSSITAATFFPYYLAITDVASPLFVPLGSKDKTAVFRALQEWATSYGPTTVIQHVYAHPHTW